MNTSEVLDLAADHIQQYGHLRGEGHGPGPVQTAPACVVGAINVACHIDQIGDVRFDREASEVARRALAEYLGRSGVVNWNDAPDRTQPEVIETLRAAAAVERAREAAEERAVVEAVSA